METTDMRHDALGEATLGEFASYFVASWSGQKTTRMTRHDRSGTAHMTRSRR